MGFLRQADQFLNFLINDPSFMSPLRAGYLQCAKTLCGMFNNPILRKSFEAGK
ncbi:hypothetical protein HA145_02605 [Prochlorococcus marinus XMU1411]|uniref:hypothetical protein n=1 Tax=Prochlorococcus marinus TaxID=1219 RepID=UPI001ADC0383|nr:hypothetical protein [Prochlorococcus marinus]MBO8243363.1 hypothetical protein [Prochlorococcus marinus XMU1411]MCR8538056.1 hypothetical protein [Prochlorococcus marinus CUG1430]